MRNTSNAHALYALVLSEQTSFN